MKWTFCWLLINQTKPHLFTVSHSFLSACVSVGLDPDCVSAQRGFAQRHLGTAQRVLTSHLHSEAPDWLPQQTVSLEKKKVLKVPGMPQGPESKRGLR